MMNNSTLSNQIEMSPANYGQGYRRGGKVKLTPAHMAVHEMDILDHLQGGKEINKKSGMRCYSHLEDLMSNPHLRAKILSCSKQKFAEGGAVHEMGAMHDEATGGGEKDKLQRLLDLLLHKKMTSPQELTREELEFLAANGEHGDREIAGIGPRTHHLFDQIAGHKTQNPRTGLPEYWSISSALSSLGHVLKGGLAGAAQGALHHLGGYASDRLGGGFRGQLLQHGANYLGDKFRGFGGHETARMVGAGLANMAGNYMRGRSTYGRHGAGGHGFGGHGENGYRPWQEQGHEFYQPRALAEKFAPRSYTPAQRPAYAGPALPAPAQRAYAGPALPAPEQRPAPAQRLAHALPAPEQRPAAAPRMEAPRPQAPQAEPRMPEPAPVGRDYSEAAARKASFKAAVAAGKGKQWHTNYDRSESKPSYSQEGGQWRVDYSNPSSPPVPSEGLRAKTPVQNTFAEHRGRVPVIPDEGAILGGQQQQGPAPQF